MAKVGSKMHEKSSGWVKIRAFMIIRIIQKSLENTTALTTVSHFKDG
jgi:hypothetical protein